MQVNEKRRAREQFRGMFKPTVYFKTINEHWIMQLFGTGGKNDVLLKCVKISDPRVNLREKQNMFHSN
jgi:hypothetical protein